MSEDLESSSMTLSDRYSYVWDFSANLRMDSSESAPKTGSDLKGTSVEKNH